MNKEKISIIVPIYKVEKYLDKCVDSIVNQTYANLEIILVHDGSPDNCGAMCDEWAKKDERIVVIHKKNGGLSDARNAGLDIVSGKYIMFVDSDDYLDLQMAEKLYAALIQNQADMAACNFVYVDEKGAFIKNGDAIKQNEVKMGKEALFTLCERRTNISVVAWNKLYKEHIFKDIRYPLGKINEDEFVIHHVLGKCKKIAFVAELLYFYVQRTGSIMADAGSVNKTDYIEALVDRCLYYYEIKNYGNVLNTFKNVVNTYMFYYKLKFDDANMKLKMKKLKKDMSIMCSKVYECLNFEWKIRGGIFYASPKLYILMIKIRSILSWIKRKCKYIINRGDRDAKF
ncbi:MAG: glycosyltransferase [Eubacteriales bacterium]